MRHMRAKVESAVADKLGMNVGDLRKQLASGQSLADIAKTKGVSHDDLVSTITSALGSAGAGSASASSSVTASATSGTTTDGTQGTDLDQLANRIADQVGRPHHHRAAASSDGTSAAVAAAAGAARAAAASSTGQDADGDNDGTLNVSL
jgi:hypothetical protein